MEAWREELYEYELVHTGIKGQKKGRRRYRNYDGTLTPAGRERYGVGPARDSVVSYKSGLSNKTFKKLDGGINRIEKKKSAVEEKKQSNSAVDKNAQLVSDMRKSKNVKKITDEGKNITSNVSDIYKNSKALKRENSVDYSKLTDDELRQRVTRLNLEKSYREALAGNTGRGERRVVRFLDSAGDVLSITGSAVAIALAIKQLKKD